MSLLSHGVPEVLVSQGTDDSLTLEQLSAMQAERKVTILCLHFGYVLACGNVHVTNTMHVTCVIALGCQSF